MLIKPVFVFRVRYPFPSLQYRSLYIDIGNLIGELVILVTKKSFFRDKLCDFYLHFAGINTLKSYMKNSVT